MNDQAPVPIALDNQDPLPESNWFWRRLFIFMAMAVLLCIKVYETSLGRQSSWTDLLILSLIIVYSIAPSAEQATKMLATVSLFKTGAVSFTRQQQTTTTADSSTTSASTVVSPNVGPTSPTPAVTGGAQKLSDAPWFDPGESGA